MVHLEVGLEPREVSVPEFAEVEPKATDEREFGLRRVGLGPWIVE